MDRVEAMSIFLAAAEAGSLSAAARRLNTPLATVSRKVSELESHLRTKLFERSSRKLKLTAAGSSYVVACKRILADLVEAERTASGEYTQPTGELIVTAPLSLGRIYLIPILADFLKAYPDIDARLILTDRVMSLSEEQVDVALRLGALPDSSLIAFRLGAVRRVTCASPAYLDARGTPRLPEELVGHDCIGHTGFLSLGLWTFLSNGTELEVQAHARLIVGSVEAACDAARAGMGITTVLDYIIDEPLEVGKLVTVLDEFQPAAIPVNFVYMAGRFLPIKLRAFLDFAGPRLKARLAAGQDRRAPVTIVPSAEVLTEPV